MNINIKCSDLKQIKSLQACNAYFRGSVNAAELYTKREGLETISYIDVTSMFHCTLSEPNDNNILIKILWCK